MARVEGSPTHLAYSRIKEAILGHRYPPGHKLSEARLAEELGVGRSPVRSALAQLENEGWLQVLPQSGSFVREPTPDDVADMTELRALLEVHAARNAASRIGKAELAALRSEFDSLDAVGVEGNFERFLALDDRFHTAVHTAAGNRRIAHILRTLKDQIHWVRVSTAAVPGRVAQSLREMDQVLAALEHGDGAAAGEAMARHVGNIAASYQAMPHDMLQEAVVE